MWIFPHQQAEKSLQNQHVLSYNPNPEAPCPIWECVVSVSFARRVVGDRSSASVSLARSVSVGQARKREIMKIPEANASGIAGGSDRRRSGDLSIFSRTLYQLSYRAKT